jgi:glycosyltransferase involved in cell wall biosynthesis
MVVVQSPTAGGSSGENFKPPLVSLVLINWNYDAYVGAAIDSIKGQDYPSLEAIVVDNGSADASRQVIAEYVAGDERFRIVHLEKNLGQLGAFLEIFKLIRGEFVTIVDADDILFPNFVSSHVQVHLALPYGVALTSSNVVEDRGRARADGRLLVVRSQRKPDHPWTAPG